uniref:Myosin_tail_1 domain-containing protein n=1 Tax=Toxocara canis TaxID=6265 RepID=A0A183URS7_TOXCA
LDVCRDQARKIRELSEENAQLQETVRQLKSALNFAHELTVSVSAEKKAARGSMMELERQLEIALRERRALEESLQRANIYINEAKKKMIAEETKNEQTQTKLNELKERFFFYLFEFGTLSFFDYAIALNNNLDSDVCDALQNEYKRRNYVVTWSKGDKDGETKNHFRQKPLSLASRDPADIKTKGRLQLRITSKHIIFPRPSLRLRLVSLFYDDQIDEIQLEYNRKLADKNKEINELVDKSRRQTNIILQQGAEISSLQERIEQLEANSARTFVEVCTQILSLLTLFFQLQHY